MAGLPVSGRYPLRDAYVRSFRSVSEFSTTDVFGYLHCGFPNFTRVLNAVALTA